MTCEHADPFTAPELLPPCKVCANMIELDRQGRELCDLLDSGTVDPAVRDILIGATTSADVPPSRTVRPWTPEAREIVRQAGS